MVDDDILTRWIWPQKEDHIPSDSAYLDLFYDQDLNQVQKQAVSDIVTPGHTIPYLISGPPGTGKTKTMVESALQIIRTDPKAKILLSAPSNAAADTLVRRLKARLRPQQLFRLNSDKRTFAEVPQTILPYCFVENDKFGLPPIKELMKFRIVVTTCSDSAIITKAKVTNFHIQVAKEHVEKHLYFYPERLPATLFWTHLLIDEAAQASEPETLAAIEVVLPAFSDVRPTLVLCGDRHQCNFPYHCFVICADLQWDLSSPLDWPERAVSTSRFLNDYSPLALIPMSRLLETTTETVPAPTWSRTTDRCLLSSWLHPVSSTMTPSSPLPRMYD